MYIWNTPDLDVLILAYVMNDVTKISQLFYIYIYIHQYIYILSIQKLISLSS